MRIRRIPFPPPSPPQTTLSVTPHRASARSPTTTQLARAARAWQRPLYVSPTPSGEPGRAPRRVRGSVAQEDSQIPPLYRNYKYPLVRSVPDRSLWLGFIPRAGGGCCIGPVPAARGAYYARNKERLIKPARGVACGWGLMRGGDTRDDAMCGVERARGHAPRRARNRRLGRWQCAGSRTGRWCRRPRGSPGCGRCRRPWWSPQWRCRHAGSNGRWSAMHPEMR